MKPFLIFCAVLFCTCLSKAQMPNWEIFDFGQAGIPQSIPTPLPKDGKGNTWILESHRLLRVFGKDTTIFGNFPSGDITYNLTISQDDKVAFLRRGLNQDDHLGYFDGTQLHFFSQPDMGLTVSSTNKFLNISHTERFIWVSTYNQIVRFDKQTQQFQVYAISGAMSKRYRDFTLVYDDSTLFKYEDSKQAWQNVLPDDGLHFPIYEDSTLHYFIVGRTAVHRQTPNSFRSFSIPSRAQLGGYNSAHIFDGKSLIVLYEKGIVIQDGENISTHFFETYASGFQLIYNTTYNPVVYKTESQQLFRIGRWEIGNCYFSYTAGNLIFELRSNAQEDYFYKNAAGKNYLFYRTDNTSDVRILTPARDTVTAELPALFKTDGHLFANSQYLWFTRTSRQSEDVIARLDYPQFLSLVTSLDGSLGRESKTISTLLRSYTLLGQEIENEADYHGVVIQYYSDGSKRKVRR